ncbi:hypothetical protein [Staphylococcus phage vB_ScaM-V1SC01]|nr:hypothetical protein [Staphylococcus phage vB_ScaM-V1SC01]
MKGIIIFYKEETKEDLGYFLGFINFKLEGLSYTTEGTLVDNDVVVLKDNQINEDNLEQFSMSNNNLVIGILGHSSLSVHIYEKGIRQEFVRVEEYLKGLRQ